MKLTKKIGYPQYLPWARSAPLPTGCTDASSSDFVIVFLCPWRSQVGGQQVRVVKVYAPRKDDQKWGEYILKKKVEKVEKVNILYLSRILFSIFLGVKKLPCWYVILKSNKLAQVSKVAQVTSGKHGKPNNKP